MATKAFLAGYKTASRLLLALVFCSYLSANPAAADSLLEKLYSGRKLDVRLGQNPAKKRVVMVDGVTKPLFWANLWGESDPKNYLRAGFNTVLAEFNYQPPEKLDAAFAEFDRYLLRVKDAGLLAIIYIHVTVHAHAGKAWAFDETWKNYVGRIVARYRKFTHLAGFAFADEPADYIEFPDDEFQKFLKGRYGEIATLNRVWNSSFKDFSAVQFEYDRNGRGRPKSSVRSGHAPFGIGAKAFDSAEFKLSRVREAHNHFERIVRKYDANTPLWSGAHNLAWPVTQTGNQWGVFFDFYPGSSGNDFETHHVWMVDVGRDGNQRASVQMLLPEHFDHHNWHLDARVLRGWLLEAVLHGAAGVAFWPWSFLGIDNLPGDRSNNLERLDVVGGVIGALTKSGIFERAPRANAAVIYQPFAEGWGSLSQVYGVMKEPTVQPLPIFGDLKFGTPFGQVDYLSAQSIRQIDLKQYSTIWAPFCVDLGVREIQKLRRYVESGGILVADIGFGALRAGKNLLALSSEARDLFGINEIQVSKKPAGEYVLEKLSNTAEFESVSPAARSTSAFRNFRVDVLANSARPILRGPGLQGVYTNKIGKGQAIFISALGWEGSWAADPLLRPLALHWFSNRTDGQLVFPEVLDNPEKGYNTFSGPVELALFDQGYALRNRTDKIQEVVLKRGSNRSNYRLEPFSAIWVMGDKITSLGTALWPIQVGPAN